MSLMNIVIDKETPKDNNSANIISLNNPMDAISALVDIANIQKAIRKTAGVRTSACCICGMCFFIDIMGTLLIWLDKRHLHHSLLAQEYL